MLLARTYLDRGAAAFASAAEELAAWPPAPTGGAVQLHLAGVTALGRLPRGMPAALHHGAMEYGDGIGLLLRCPQLLLGVGQLRAHLLQLGLLALERGVQRRDARAERRQHRVVGHR